MGYFFFFITTLFYVGLTLFAISKPEMAGPEGMGYGLGLVFLGLGFGLSSLMLTITLLARGNVHWVADDASVRTGIMLLSWLLIGLTTFFCAVFNREWPTDTPYPQFLHWLALSYGQIWIPLLWLAACFLSLNANWQADLSPNVLRVCFGISFILSAIYSGGLLVGYLSDSYQRLETETASQKQRTDEWHQKVLDEIAAHQPTDPIINLLTQTTQVRPEDTRAAALAKVKTHPNWEAEILALLNEKRTYREVYYFLDGNAVEHPSQFAQPLNQSILWLAETIRQDIAKSDNLQDWSFDMYGIENLLRAIDGQFLNQGVDFLPNVVKLQQALNAPRPDQYKNVRFTASDSVDEWLRKHRK
jgi:hypothetical protein